MNKAEIQGGSEKDTFHFEKKVFRTETATNEIMR